MTTGRPAPHPDAYQTGVWRPCFECKESFEVMRVQKRLPDERLFCRKPECRKKAAELQARKAS